MTPESPASALLPLALLVITLGYVATCVLWPFKECRACHGAGKLRSALIRAVRLCRHCNATGLRPRLGLKAWNAYRRLQRDTRRRR